MFWYYFLICISESLSVVSDSLQPHGIYSPWTSPGQNTGMGSLSLLQGIFPTQGLNPSLPHCRQNLYCLSHQGSPRILEWVAYPFSRGSSRPRNQTGVSCIAGGFFTTWAIREVNWWQYSWDQMFFMMNTLLSLKKKHSNSNCNFWHINNFYKIIILYNLNKSSYSTTVW